jgi:hypothetical protein
MFIYLNSIASSPEKLMDRRSALAAVALPVLNGCASKQTVPFHRIDINDYAGTVHLPTLNQSVTVNIGERMIATKRVAVLPYVGLDKETIVESPYSDK